MPPGTKILGSTVDILEFSESSVCDSFLQAKSVTLKAIILYIGDMPRGEF